MLLVSDNPGLAQPTVQVSAASGQLDGRLLCYVQMRHAMLLCITHCSALQTVAAGGERKRPDTWLDRPEGTGMAGMSAGEPAAAIALKSETTHLTI